MTDNINNETPETAPTVTPRPYRGAHRANLHDDSDIQALEAQRQAALNAVPGQPEPTVEEVQEDPSLVEPAKNDEDAVWKKRYADLRRYLGERDKQWQEQLETLKEQLQAATQKNLQLPTSEEEISEWAKQFPEAYKIVKAIAIQEANEQAKAVAAKLEEAEKRIKQAERREAEAMLRERHSDLDQLREAPEFHEWAKNQSPLIQHALYRSPNWQDCAAAIDLFKAQTGWGKPKEEPKKSPGRPRKEIEAAAEAVNVGSARISPTPEQFGGKKVWRESEVSRLKPYQWDQFEQDIIAARREGRFVYDLSGGAM